MIAPGVLLFVKYGISENGQIQTEFTKFIITLTISQGSFPKKIGMGTPKNFFYLQNLLFEVPPCPALGF